MNFSIRTLALAGSLLVVACGGGGGGGNATPGTGTATTPPPAPTGPQAVVITETSAKPVAANALDTAQNLSATQSTSLVAGVEVQTDASAPNSAILVQRVAVALLSQASGASGGTLPIGVAISQTVSCPQGGALTLSGNVSGSTGLVAGDHFTISASNCKLAVDSVASTMNGSLSITVLSGSLKSVPPFQVVMSVVVTDLSVQSGATTVMVSGDTRIDLTASSSTSQTVVVTGASLRSQTSGTTPHTTTLKNYSQSVTVSGLIVTSSVSGTVESDSTRLGSAGGIYTISTPTPVVFNSSTKVATAGVVKVVGAANSQLLLTVGSNNTVTIQVDANGDGVFEKTLTSTLTELSGLI